MELSDRDQFPRSDVSESSHDSTPIVDIKRVRADTRTVGEAVNSEVTDSLLFDYQAAHCLPKAKRHSAVTSCALRLKNSRFSRNFRITKATRPRTEPDMPVLTASRKRFTDPNPDPVSVVNVGMTDRM